MLFVKALFIKMKKTAVIIFILIFALAFSACGKRDSFDMEPEEIIDTLHEEYNVEIPCLTERLDLADELVFKYHFFISPSDAVEEAYISTPTDEYANIPFFLGILKMNSPEDAAKAAEDIEANVDMNKLICAAFEAALVKVRGNTVIVILDISSERADSLMKVFDSIK